MVSKVAVIALVAIVACPILLGYGLNLNEVSMTDYKATNDTVNVTPLLATSNDWSMASGDPYQLNNPDSNIFTSSYVGDVHIFPMYNKVTGVKTSMRMHQGTFANFSGGTENELQKSEHYFIAFDYNASSSVYVTVKGYIGSNLEFTFNNLSYLSWDLQTGLVAIGLKYNSNSEFFGTDNIPGLTSLVFSLTGMSNVYMTFTRVVADGQTVSGNQQNSYVDLSSGYYFKKFCNQPMNSGWDVKLPEGSMKALLSVDLDSMTNSAATFWIEGIKFNKTTTNGVVSWQATNGSDTIDLYYDSSRNDNTYQIMFTDLEKTEVRSGITYNVGKAELRYIGSWNKIIAEANYYQSYELEYLQRNTSNVLDNINITPDSTSQRTPTVRVDYALFKAFQYPVIENNTYTPSNFKTNPATTIDTITRYGTQIVFGGNTYTVTNGSITLESHQIPVEGLVFSSVPVAGGYENRIGNTVVSTTVSPSSITLNGKWAASISTVSMESYTYTHTEWTPGQFGWDGLDQNFLMVGLLTSIGVFIALGIYMRRTKAALWPLLIVCGGAAMLFFIML